MPKSLIYMHSRRLKLQLRETGLPQPCLDILVLETNLLCADPRRRIHVHTADR